MSKKQKHEYSCGAVLYTRRGKKLQYILVVERNGNIGFPKGHREGQETEKETATREIFEETGLRAQFCGGFRVTEQYPRGLHAVKHVTYFLARYNPRERIVRGQDIRRVLVLSYEKAVKLITYDSAREILKKAHEVVTAQDVLGKQVAVVVDRPMGSFHPDYKDMKYPINYGYIEGIIAPDGEEQDAYIIGVNEPVEAFEGRVIAVVRRENDVEEKWVVAPEGQEFSKKKIAELIEFQEKYFRFEIIM